MKVLYPNFEKRGGFVTVVTIDRVSSQLLMVAFADEEAFQKTLETGQAHYWSTSRNRLWKKGETSGDVQFVSDVLIDCDGDALVYVVDQQGDGACHTKAKSCFYRSCIRGQIMEAPNAGQKEELLMGDLPVHSRFEGVDHRTDSDTGMLDDDDDSWKSATHPHKW